MRKPTRGDKTPLPPTLRASVSRAVTVTGQYATGAYNCNFAASVAVEEEDASLVIVSIGCDAIGAAGIGEVNGLEGVYFYCDPQMMDYIGHALLDLSARARATRLLDVKRP